MDMWQLPWVLFRTLNAFQSFVSFTSQLIAHDTIEINIDARIAAPKFSTLKPGTIAATNTSIRPLIIKINRPKLNTVIGRVRNINSGRRIALSNPNRTAVIINDNGFSTVTHGRIFTTTKIAAAVIRVLSRNLLKLSPFPLAKSFRP